MRRFEMPMRFVGVMSGSSGVGSLRVLDELRIQELGTLACRFTACRRRPVAADRPCGFPKRKRDSTFFNRLDHGGARELVGNVLVNFIGT